MRINFTCPNKCGRKILEVYDIAKALDADTDYIGRCKCGHIIIQGMQVGSDLYLFRLTSTKTKRFVDIRGNLHFLSNIDWYYPYTLDIED